MTHYKRQEISDVMRVGDRLSQDSFPVVSISEEAPLGRPQSKEGQASRILVAVRVRPLSTSDRSKGETDIWHVQGTSIQEMKDDGITPTGETRNYDYVFGPEKTNEELYENSCRQIVPGILEGYNGAILAYGQTSSGKTFTMKGIPGKNPGISLRAVDELFSLLVDRRNSEWSVHVSYLEIYNENVTDLLSPKDTKAKIPIVEDKVLGPTARDAAVVQIRTAGECLKLFGEGEKRRAYAETAQNDRSSRSHTVFRIRVESRTTAKVSQEDMRDIAHQFNSAQQELTADRASMYLVDRETHELYTQCGEIALHLPMSLGIAGACATSGTTINVDDAYKDPRFNSNVDEKSGYITKSVLCVPIKHLDGQVIGVVQFVNKTEPQGAAFDKQDEARIEALAKQIAPRVNASSSTSRRGQLDLVDLAGSERVGKAAKADDNMTNVATMKEGTFINKSLMTLGYCISSLAQNSAAQSKQPSVGQRSVSEKHIQFRDSKLTHLLATSLGGNARTFMVCAISPAACNRNESLSTLLFALRAEMVVNQVKANQKTDKKMMLKAYEDEIQKLKEQIKHQAHRRTIPNGVLPSDLVARLGLARTAGEPAEISSVDQAVAALKATPAEVLRMKAEISRLQAGAVVHRQEKERWGRKAQEIRQLQVEITELRIGKDNHREERRQWKSQVKELKQQVQTLQSAAEGGYGRTQWQHSAVAAAGNGAYSDPDWQHEHGSNEQASASSGSEARSNWGSQQPTGHPPIGSLQNNGYYPGSVGGNPYEASASSARAPRPGDGRVHTDPGPHGSAHTSAMPAGSFSARQRHTVQTLSTQAHGNFSPAAAVTSSSSSAMPQQEERRIDPLLGGQAVTFDEMQVLLRQLQLNSRQLAQHWESLRISQVTHPNGGHIPTHNSQVENPQFAGGEYASPSYNASHGAHPCKGGDFREVPTSVNIQNEVSKLLGGHPWTSQQTGGSTLTRAPPPDWAHMLVQPCEIRPAHLHSMESIETSHRFQVSTAAALTARRAAPIDTYAQQQNQNERRSPAKNLYDPSSQQASKVVAPVSDSSPAQRAAHARRAQRTPREIPWDWLVMKGSLGPQDLQA